MLKVSLFGAGQATYYDRPISGFPNQQAGLLLAYLLLNRRYSQNREQLAAVFWGDYPTHSARKNFRNTLWRLRQSLQSAGAPPDEYVLATEESISFYRLSRYWLDVEAFEAASAQAQHITGQAMNAEQAERLTAAADLYAGDLLEGIYGDWALYDRERLRLVYLNVLAKLMAYQGSQGRFEHALEYGDLILNRDRTRENVHRQMMVLHWCAGNRAAALAQYKLCSQILREDMNASPMEETIQLYELMVSNRFKPDGYLGYAVVSPGRMGNEALASTVAQSALQQIQLLQKKLEETAAEVYRIEQLIRQALEGSGL